MEQNVFVLAAMSPAGTDLFSPVQIQKLLFILDKNVPEETNGPHFEFEPYHYGPFDKEVYSELNNLENNRHIRIIMEGLSEKRSYQLTDAGYRIGSEAFKELTDPIQKYISDIVEIVRSLSFAELVSTIYAAYPEMKVNSVFAAETK